MELAHACHFDALVDLLQVESDSMKTCKMMQGYRVFWPTARNTNLNNIAAAGEAVTSPAYAAKPDDCQYADTPNRCVSRIKAHFDFESKRSTASWEVTYSIVC